MPRMTPSEALVETLVAEGALTLEQVRRLAPSHMDWDADYPSIERAMQAVGIEKLKPIYEALQEKYEYDTIRLARAYYMLKTDNAQVF